MATGCTETYTKTAAVVTSPFSPLLGGLAADQAGCAVMNCTLLTHTILTPSRLAVLTYGDFLANSI